MKTKNQGWFYSSAVMSFENLITVAVQDPFYAADYDISKGGAKLGYRSQIGRVVPRLAELQEGDERSALPARVAFDGHSKGLYIHLTLNPKP